MEKDFKKLKRDLLAYRHIYAIYAILIIALFVLTVVEYNVKTSSWAWALNAAILVFLLFVMIFRLPGERLDIKRKADCFLLTLKSLKEGNSERITKLLILENEFDILKNKDNGLRLIQERIANIHFESINKSIETARKLGGYSDEMFITSFSVPDTFEELNKIAAEMSKEAKEEQKAIEKMFNKINELASKF